MELVKDKIELPKSTILALNQMQVEKSHNEQTKKYRKLMTFEKSTDREFDEMNYMIKKIDKKTYLNNKARNSN